MRGIDERAESWATMSTGISPLPFLPISLLTNGITQPLPCKHQRRKCRATYRRLSPHRRLLPTYSNAHASLPRLRGATSCLSSSCRLSCLYHGTYLLNIIFNNKNLCVYRVRHDLLMVDVHQPNKSSMPATINFIASPRCGKLSARDARSPILIRLRRPRAVTTIPRAFHYRADIDIVGEMLCWSIYSAFCHWRSTLLYNAYRNNCQ